MIVIGITGVPCSVKTTVSNMFRELGAEVIDADLIGHQLLSPFTPTWRKIRQYFGPGIVDNNTGEIDREKLGSMVFRDHMLLNKLNALMHPLIIEEIRRKLEQLGQGETRAAVLDVPLLIEVGLHKAVDAVIVVTVKSHVQLARLRKKNPHLTDLEIDQRMRSQLNQDVKQEYADFIIDNSGDLDKTRQQVYSTFQELMKKQSTPQE
ncbi:MAG: dephospho-CoA kinase [bacterium]